MNAQLALRRLWWKELRQLMPMLILLPTLGLLLLVLYAITGNRTAVALTPSVIVFLGMPGLFAAGGGALLVGHEKELRTLDWLASLPIAPRWIVRVKLGAALAGLLVLWLLSGLLFAAAAAADVRLSTTDIPWLTWPLNSLFVLLAGFALAWWTKSALVALLLVVPVATVPFILAYAIDSMAPWHASIFDKPSAKTLLACQLIGSGVALWLSDRMGRRALAPQSAAGTSTASLFPALERYRSRRQQAGYSKVQAPLPALVWQSACQNRALLVGISLMLGITVVIVATVGLRPSPNQMLIANLLGFLATSWLGVSVFQSDALHQRVRFLADRGISPRLIWLTRHAAPASILALFVLLLALVFALTTLHTTLLGGAATALAATMCAVVLIYLIAHWAGQVIPSPIVSTIAAPFIVLGAILYGSFSLTSLGTPWWLLLLILLIPLAATMTMTRRWMDRRLGFSYWASHAGFLGALLFIPWTPLLITAARQPAMPAEVARELNELSEKSLSYLVTPTELVIGTEKEAGGDNDAGGAFAPMEVRWEQTLDRIENQLRETSGPISIASGRVIFQLRGIATLTRMNLDQTPTPTDEASDADTFETARQETLRLYQRSVDLLVQIAQRMRLSPRIIEQDAADLLEIWLLKELRRQQAREHLGESLHGATAGMLADASARNEARARAVALSWWNFQEENRHGRHLSTSLGGYDLHEMQAGVGTMRGRLLHSRRVGVAVTDLWQLARGGAEAATNQRLRRIAEYWGRADAGYGIGPAGDYLRADDVDRFVHTGFQYLRGAIANQWHAGWERQAAELFEE